MQGSVKDMGVHASDPRTEINLSNAFPSEIQNNIVNATMIVLDKFLSHIRFFDFGIPLKM